MTHDTKTVSFVINLVQKGEGCSWKPCVQQHSASNQLGNTTLLSQVNVLGPSFGFYIIEHGKKIHLIFISNLKNLLHRYLADTLNFAKWHNAISWKHHSFIWQILNTSKIFTIISKGMHFLSLGRFHQCYLIMWNTRKILRDVFLNWTNSR